MLDFTNGAFFERLVRESCDAVGKFRSAYPMSQDCQGIHAREPSERVLQSTEFRRLKRSMGQLEQVKTESARKLADILNLEYRALRESAEGHAASQALEKTVECTPPSATITVVSSLSSNGDALSITLEKLKEKGYNTVQVGIKIS